MANLIDDADDHEYDEDDIQYPTFYIIFFWDLCGPSDHSTLVQVRPGDGQWPSVKIHVRRCSNVNKLSSFK